MKKIIGLFLIVVMMMSIYITEDAYAASINKSSITLTKNKTYKLKLKGTSIRKVSTSNKKVATISKTGVVKAKGKGTCTVSLNGKDNKTYKCKVKVQTPKLNAKSITLTKGKKFDLNLTGTLKAKTWSTSNSKVATITRGGVVKALSKGTIYAICKCDGVTYKCKVKAEVPTLNITETTLYSGDSTDLNVIGSSKSKQWYSSDTSIASIDKKGYITAKGAGTTNVNVKVDGIVYSCKVTVKDNYSLEGKNVSIIGDSISTYKDYIVSGYKTAYPNGNVTNVSYTWWKKLCDETGLNLLSNASYSTSKCIGDSVSVSNAYAACSTKRIADLSKDGVNPDIVICYIGINDYVNRIPLGNWLISKSILNDTSNVIKFDEAYSIMLKKIRQGYPNAKIYCCTLLDTPKSSMKNNVDINVYNSTIKGIASYYNAQVIDLHGCGINAKNLSLYMYDKSLHPNKQGMNLIKTAVKNALQQ